MPSYRVEIEITGLQPGTDPSSVLPEAEHLLAVHHRVEGRSVELINGRSGPRPQIHLRYLVEPTNTDADDLTAYQSLLRLIEELKPVVSCGRWVLKRGPGRNWTYLASGQAGANQSE